MTSSATVDVLCDGAGRLGPLSYKVPSELDAKVGDAVAVPFGKRTAVGVVLGPAADPGRATRELADVYGRRTGATEIELAHDLARRHLCDVAAFGPRLAPAHRKGNPPMETEAPTLTGAVVVPEGYRAVPAQLRRRLLVCAPLVNQAALAALEAHRISAGGGQVLVLCPTKELVRAVVAGFAGGAARLDEVPGARATSAWKGFEAGTVTIGVGTRNAALWSARNLAGIVVVDEDHPGHCEDRAPYTHARDIAAMRSAATGAELVLTSSFPSGAALGAGVKTLALGGPADWPEMILVDRSSYPPGDRDLPEEMRGRILSALRCGVSPVIVCGPRAARRLCVVCGTARPCTRCGDDACEEHREAEACDTCCDTRTRLSGWDTRRVNLRFPGARAVLAQQLGDIGDGGLVVVADIDGALRARSLTPDARAAQVLCCAARAAGRSGTLVVATSNPTAPLLADWFSKRDLITPARRTWDAAKEAGTPPFGRIVTVRGTGASPNVAGWPGDVFGPRRLPNDWELVVRCEDNELETLRRHVDRLRRGSKIRVRVE